MRIDPGGHPRCSVAFTRAHATTSNEPEALDESGGYANPDELVDATASPAQRGRFVLADLSRAVLPTRCATGIQRHGTRRGAATRRRHTAQSASLIQELSGEADPL